jgi:amidase
MLKSKPAADAFVVQKLRAAGAVILGKNNLSQWANFRSPRQVAGWSSVGGFTANPYGGGRTPCGSSSGSAVAVSARLAVVSVGTETAGSIVCPSSVNGVVGMKPTLGAISGTGIIPISHAQDTAGPIARNVTDAAVLMNVIKGTDSADSATAEADGKLGDLTKLDRDALSGKRIGIWRGAAPGSGAVLDAAVEKIRSLGAIVVDPADVPAINGQVMYQALLCEFKRDINDYLSKTPGEHPKDLAGLIAFNNASAAVEMKDFKQEIFDMAQRTNGGCEGARTTVRNGARKAMDDTLDGNTLDAIVAVTTGPAPAGGGMPPGSSAGPPAVAGYPHITVPGCTGSGTPAGISFMGRQWSDADMLRYAYAYEQASRCRKAPEIAGSAASVAVDYSSGDPATLAD